ncbi:uncharacterized protein ATC70_012963 [Mucor velutinosus]|uniref:Uncharacterized protein n=1 Tax=Mucor velutinosus TaxID=708070 RepID=A0AAN7D9D3_9FUNG|nr:hypothetical protein ATC70_012963 [Mucor velutinosus]
MDGLRTLFIEAKWITQDDPKNRLIFSSFIESLFQYLVAHKDMNLGREKKYLLLSIDKVAIHLSSAQMQSAKELIAVSKKLAASDFLLVPTDLGDAVSMDLTALDKSVYNSVKEIIIKHILSIIRGKRYYKRSIFRFKNGNKKTTQKERHNMNATTQPLFSVISLRQIIEEIVNRLYEIFSADRSKPLHTSLYGLEGSKEILRGLTCGTFMNGLLTDASVKEFIDQLVCEVKGIHNKYSNFQSSPDGIQDVILHCHLETSIFYREIFQIALLDANFVDAQADFIGGTQGQDTCFSAMQKPIKMIQIANALLPPTVWNGESCEQVELVSYSSGEDDLLPPNSFYAQASINNNHIRFILNKVIAVSSANDTIQKSTFTVKEMSVKLEGIFGSVCDNMWNHLMMPECQGEITRHDRCDTHSAGEYSAANYRFFKCSIQKMTDELLQKRQAKYTREFDVYHAIPTSKECACSFQISFRALMNIGLQPAISHIATIIASSLASNSFFGLYTLSALIIMDESREMIIQDHNDTFKKTMQSCLKAHSRRAAVFYGKEAVLACGSLGNWCTGLQQIFGKGSYSQVSSSGYLLRFSSLRMGGVDERFGLYNYHSNSLKQGDFEGRPNEFVILEKGHTLDPNGSAYAFYQRDFNVQTLRLGKIADLNKLLNRN